MDKKIDFNVEKGLLLEFKNLYAKIVVTDGSDGKVSVVIKGDEEIIKKIEVEQKSSKKICFKSKDDDNVNNIVITSSDSRSFGKVTIANISNSIVVTGGSIFIGSGSNIISGSKQVLVEMEVSVPKGTDVDVSGVCNFNLVGVEGRLWADISGQAYLEVQKVSNPKVSCSGQSEVRLFDATGNAKLNVSGNSSAYIAGKLEDIEVSASGRSRIDVHANCQDINASASGMSNVFFHGTNNGRVHTNASGMSSISGL
jgi:hypothetical protein